MGVMAVAFFLGPVAAWEKKDDFGTYPPGSDAAPAWETTGIEWEVQEGRLTVAEPGKRFALLTEAPLGRQVTVEATLTVEAPLGDDWKIAGVVLWQKDGNYWHLALVEAPEAQDRKHFVELTESLDGRWLAQSETETSLPMAENVGSEFDWQYGQPYRLRLELTPEGIRGTVREEDGMERARLAYRFDHPQAVTFGRPGLDSGGFRAAFDDVAAQVEELVAPPEERAEFPPCDVPGDPTRRGPATGFFRVAERKGLWWVFTPQGEAFYILGTDHVNFNAHWCEKLGYAPYHRFVQQKYGSEAAWGQETLRRLKAWGFNSLTAGHSPSLRYQGLPHVEFLSLGAGFAALHPLAPPGHWTGFPNVFHPKFQRYCEKMARQQCAPQRDNPWLLGYFLDNELEWFGKPPAGSLLHWAASKPAADPAKPALVQFFRERYRDIAAFNRAWGTDAPDFASLLNLTAFPPAATEAAERDQAAWVRRLAERYFAVTTAAIRKHDPHHLLLGCRFAGSAPEGIWDVVGQYCDIVSINLYPRVDLETGEVLGVESLLREAYAKAKRPFMVTEWSFPALDAVDSEGRLLPSQHGAGMRVDTQEQKAQCCELMQDLLFHLPFVVGSDYFMWADEPALGISSTFPEDSNYGLVSESDQPYEPLVKMFAQLNAQVYHSHGGRAMGSGSGGPYSPPSPAWHRPDAKERAPVVLWFVVRHEAERSAVPEGKDVLLTVPVEEGPALELGSWKVRLRQRRHPVRAWLRAGKGLVAYDAAGREVPVQGEAWGGEVELTFRLPEVWPEAPFPLWLYPVTPSKATPAVRVEQDGERLIVDNGVLRLIQEEPDGDAWDRIELNGVPLGRFTPLIHQRVGQDLWVPPERVTSMQVWNGPLRTVVEMVLERRREGEAITPVGEGGMFQPQRQSPRAFRTAYRFFIYPAQNWFLAQFVWLENTDPEAWQFVDYFHYTPSFLGGSVEGDEVGGPNVPNYYLPFASWKDPQVGLQYGVVGLQEKDFGITFWLDEGGGQHPDARRPVDIKLRPNCRYDEPQPRLVVFGESSKVPSPSYLVQRLRRWHRTRADFLPVEEPKGTRRK